MVSFRKRLSRMRLSITILLFKSRFPWNLTVHTSTLVSLADGILFSNELGLMSFLKAVLLFEFRVEVVLRACEKSYCSFIIWALLLIFLNFADLFITSTASLSCPRMLSFCWDYSFIPDLSLFSSFLDCWRCVNPLDVWFDYLDGWYAEVTLLGEFIRGWDDTGLVFGVNG